MHEREEMMKEKPFGFYSCVKLNIPLVLIVGKIIAAVDYRHSTTFYIIDEKIERFCLV